MVDNQHKKIKGYRDLTEEEIALMNKIKNVASECEVLVSEMQSRIGSSELDTVWLADGELTLKKGFMSLVRSVAKPNSF